MIDYTTVLEYLYPDSEWMINANDYAQFEWYSDGDKPSLETLDAAWPEAKNWKLLIGVRAKRDRLLAESDWTQMPDAPVDQAAWAEYRQALRDLPENTIDPENPIWPTRPDEGGE